MPIYYKIVMPAAYCVIGLGVVIALLAVAGVLDVIIIHLRKP